MSEELEFVADNEEEVVEEPVAEELPSRNLPKVFLEEPERVGNPRSPYKIYFIMDYDEADEWLHNVNRRFEGLADYAVILDEVAEIEGNRDFLLFNIMKAVVSGGTLYVGNAYDRHEMLENWSRKRKEGEYIPYIKP